MLQILLPSKVRQQAKPVRPGVALPTVLSLSKEGLVQHFNTSARTEFCGAKYFLKPSPSPPFRPRRTPPSATRFFRPQSRPHQNDKQAASKTFASSGARPISSCVAWTASRCPRRHQSPRSCAPSLLQTPACRRGRGRSSRLQHRARWARRRPDNCAVPAPNLGAANGPRPCLHHRLPPALL